MEDEEVNQDWVEAPLAEEPDVFAFVLNAEGVDCSSEHAFHQVWWDVEEIESDNW